MSLKLMVLALAVAASLAALLVVTGHCEVLGDLCRDIGWERTASHVDCKICGNCSLTNGCHAG